MNYKPNTALKKYCFMSAIAVAIVVLAAITLRHNLHKPQNNTSAANIRIVSLAPSITEILFKLGLADCIVGVTDICDYPAQAKNIACIGSFGKPNIERLMALDPDMVIATDFENDDIAKLLRNCDIEVLDFRIRNFQELFESLRKIGKATGRLPQAEKIVMQMQNELKTIIERFKKIQPSQRPRVFVEIWYDPITTAGKTSFIDEVITRAGGVNVAGNIGQDYCRINPEKVIEWNPDVIVICYMGQDGSARAQLAGRIGWNDISAVREGRIIEDFSSDIILRPGPRLIDGVKMLNQNLYGTEPEKYMVDDVNE